MIVVRDIFRLKYGMAKPFKAAMAESKAMMEAAGFTGNMRMLADYVGDAYTFVLEGTFESMAAWEAEMSGMNDPKWGEHYHTKIVPLIESGKREVFTIVE